jgi:Sec-independent protein secretion pathway component TatC
MNSGSDRDSRLENLEARVQQLEKRLKNIIIGVVVFLVLCFLIVIRYGLAIVSNEASSGDALDRFGAMYGTASALATQDGGQLHFTDYQLTALAELEQSP